MIKDYKSVPLQDIASIIRGVTFSKGDALTCAKPDYLPVLRAGNIQSKLIIDDGLVFIPLKKITSKQYIKKNDIVMCMSSGSPKIVGKSAFSYQDFAGSVGAFCCIIRPLVNQTDSKFLYYFLNSSVFQNWTALSAGVNIKNIKHSELCNFSIPLPSLSEQKRIATILDKANSIRQQRQESLALMDTFIKSVFLDMFGDPVTNPMGWEKGIICDIVKETQYGTSSPASEDGEYIYLRMNNITYSGHLDLSLLKYISVSDKDFKKYSVINGDVLFNRTNSKELVGKTCVFRDAKAMIIAGYIIRVRTSERAHPDYLSAFLNSSYGKSTLLGMCKAIVGQANINA